MAASTWWIPRKGVQPNNFPIGRNCPSHNDALFTSKYFRCLLPSRCQTVSFCSVIAESFLTICIGAALAKKPFPPTTEFSSLSVGSASTTDSNASSQRAPLSKEAQFYYAGLPSGPPLVGRSSTTPWEAPSGAEAYNKPKALGTVGRHAIKDVWEDGLSHKVVEHLDSKKVM